MSNKARRPAAVAFDVIETLFAIEPLREKLKAVGLPGHALEVWFARVLRDAFALEVTGEYKPFGEVAGAALEALASEQKACPERSRRIDGDKSKIEETIKTFAGLPAHPDVKPAFQILRDADVRIAVLTNGSAETTKRMVEKAKLGNFVERYISIDQVKHWKPAREVYLHAAKVLDVDPAELALVAGHDWDIQGANQAGLITGFVARKGKNFSAAMRNPDVAGGSLDDVVRQLLALPER
jgi:2-haloacid dehalogenase